MSRVKEATGAKVKAPTLSENRSYSFVIPGAPRTKKNHGRVIRRGGKPVHIQSEAHEQWRTSSMWWLMGRIAEMRKEDLDPFPIAKEINVSAVFYRDRYVGDFTGYAQALGDLLENARIIMNDSLIASWDGTRLEKDAANPRIEVTLTEL